MNERVFLQNRSDGHNKYYALMQGSDGQVYAWYGALTMDGSRFKTCTLTRPKVSLRAQASKKRHHRNYQDVTGTHTMWIDSVARKMDQLERDLTGAPRPNFKISDYLVEF
jgi:hypothetical protein